MQMQRSKQLEIINLPYCSFRILPTINDISTYIFFFLKKKKKFEEKEKSI